MKGKVLIALFIPIIAGVGVIGSIKISGNSSFNNTSLSDTKNSEFKRLDIDKFQQEPRLVMFVGEGDKRTVCLSDLRMAESISEVIPNYPSSWINDYNSVEISLTDDTSLPPSKGRRAELTSGQKALLTKAKISSHIRLVVNYQTANTVNNKIENRSMNVNLLIMPDQQAEFDGGFDSLMVHLNRMTKTFINYKTVEELTFSFLVDKEGVITNTKIMESSGDEEVDHKFKQAINSLPAWVPAKNKSGESVSQRFEYRVFSSLSSKGC